MSDPDGQTWRVSRRWLPLPARARRRVRDSGAGGGWPADGGTDGGSDCGPDGGSDGGSYGGSDGWGFDLSDGGDLVGLVLGLVLLAVVAVLAPLLLPVVELVVLVVLLPFAVLGRVLLGRRWTIEVRRGWRPVHYELTRTRRDPATAPRVSAASGHLPWQDHREPNSGRVSRDHHHREQQCDVAVPGWPSA